VTLRGLTDTAVGDNLVDYDRVGMCFDRRCGLDVEGDTGRGGGHPAVPSRAASVPAVSLE
jgi:hypothetical protein